MKTAIVGIGAISGLHINSLLKCNHSIVALCDIKPEKCKEANERFGLDAQIYNDYEKMIDEQMPNCVHICTPHYLHASMICYALERNIHVLCEKPLAISSSQLSQIEKSVLRTKAYLGLCQQNRYNESIRYIKERLSNKKIISAYGNLVWQRDAAYYASEDWRGKWSSEGGGVMINQALHTLDVLQWLCGMPKSVTAHVSNNSLGGIIETEDTAYGLFNCAGDSSFVITATNAAKFSFPITLAFYCEDYTVELSDNNIIINGEFVSLKDNRPIFGKEVWGTGHEKLIEDFYNCIENKRKFELDFYEGRKVVDLILAMYKSNGQKINF